MKHLYIDIFEKISGIKAFFSTKHGASNGSPYYNGEALNELGLTEMTFVQPQQVHEAKIGIVGKDTLLEEGKNLYEVLDLKLGKCRMCVCGDTSKPLPTGFIRVASKYPNIARDYFSTKKNQTIEIIKLNGSVELGPIIGLADVIVDIVESGKTLYENGLGVIEEICPISARLVVNRVSMKMEKDRIMNIVNKIGELV